MLDLMHRSGVRCLGVLLLLWGFSSVAKAAPVYHAGVSPVCGGCVVGSHLVSPDSHPSVPGLGGSGLNKVNGTLLNGERTYIWDQQNFANLAVGPVQDLTDGIANRGNPGFAMMIWDMGVALDSMALFTHQDHYSGGLILDNFVAQDVMEYSVWGSNDGDNFVLLSDVIGFNINGGGVGTPTYTFAGTAPNDIYRGGSSEEGIINAYTRDYTFAAAYRYYGIRSSTVTLGYNNGVLIQGQDGDPEIDAVFGHAGPIFNPDPNLVPEPPTVTTAALMLAWVAYRSFRSKPGRPS